MQTITTLELRLEEARLACEKMQRKLHRKWFASLFLPEYFEYFEEKLELLLELIDDTLGLIATSERPLQRTEMLSRELIENGLRSQPINLIQTMSNQGAIAQELASIWQHDEEQMAEIEDLLFEFNHSLREIQRIREQADNKLIMDFLGFPSSDSLPQTISLRLMKDLFDPDFQLPTGHTIIELPPKRLAKPNLNGSAWPTHGHRPRN